MYQQHLQICWPFVRQYFVVSFIYFKSIRRYLRSHHYVIIPLFRLENLSPSRQLSQTCLVLSYFSLAQHPSNTIGQHSLSAFYLSSQYVSQFSTQIEQNRHQRSNLYITEMCNSRELFRVLLYVLLANILVATLSAVSYYTICFQQIRYHIRTYSTGQHKYMYYSRLLECTVLVLHCRIIMTVHYQVHHVA